MARSACVLGAGIQGTCVALMLAKQGFDVVVLDMSTDIMRRASLTYEGRIHLGFVYGMDKSLGTGRKMLHDALHFGPYLEYLLERELDWTAMRSLPTDYLVAPDSMLSPAEAAAYFAQLQTIYSDLVRDERLHYLGTRPAIIFERTPTPPGLNPDFPQACFRTIEASVDQPELRERIREKIDATSSITLRMGHRIEGVRPDHGGLVVHGALSDGGPFAHRADVVCNCLWEGRVRVDRSMGVAGHANPSIRLKYGLVVNTNAVLERLRSFTVIHGPYGNFVHSPQSSRAFFSWYTACLRGFMEYGSLPEEWERACEGETPDRLWEQLRKSNWEHFRRVIPTLPEFDLVQVKAGVILAEGNRDISDRSSALHRRRETPVHAFGNYYSVSTSKYTSAPRNTMLLEAMIRDGAPGSTEGRE